MNPVCIEPRLRHQNGSVSVDVVLALFLTFVLIVGTILLFESAVDFEVARARGDALTKQSDQIFDLIGRLNDDTEAVNLRYGQKGTEGRAGDDMAIEFLVNIDGDCRTGDFVVGDSRGLERVVILRPGSADPRLVIRIFSGGNNRPLESVLSRILDKSDPGAFKIESRVYPTEITQDAEGSYPKISGSKSLKRYRVVLRLSAGGRNERFSREFKTSANMI